MHCQGEAHVREGHLSQHERAREKAKGYGTTFSRLVLTAVEAYARTYDEVPDKSSLVVVNYGIWYKMDFRLQGITGDVGHHLLAIRSAAMCDCGDSVRRAVDG